MAGPARKSPARRSSIISTLSSPSSATTSSTFTAEDLISRSKQSAGGLSPTSRGCASIQALSTDAARRAPGHPPPPNGGCSARPGERQYAPDMEEQAPRLRALGFWFSPSEHDFPRPQALVDRDALQLDRQRVAAYLRAGRTHERYRGYS